MMLRRISLSASTSMAARRMSSSVLSNLSDMGLSEDQESYRDLARGFSEKELAPYAAEWDRNSHFPIPTLRKAAELGFAAMNCSPEHGGTGLGRRDSAVVVEELAAGCTSTAAYLTIHNMCAWMVDTFGTEEQRAAWIPRFASMDILASYCLTEPGSGSDAASLQTKAVLEGDHYVLNGSKAFISGGGVTDVYLVMCRTNDNAGAGGVSCLLVEKGMPGLSFGNNEAKMGWKSQPTAAVFFDNVKVPKGNLIGAEGKGFKIAMGGLDGGRLSIGACSLGAGRAALECASEYATERKQFGKAISSNQSLAFKLANMAAELHSARLVLRHAAAAMDALKGQNPENSPAGTWPGGQEAVTVACAMAKLKATDAGFAVCNDALQIHGGYGYLNDYPVERMLRDVRVHQILEGTNEIMQHIISRAIMK